MDIFSAFWQLAFIGGVIGLLLAILILLDGNFNEKIIRVLFVVISGIFSRSSSMLLSVVLYTNIYKFLSEAFDNILSGLASLIICILAFLFLIFFILLSTMLLFGSIFSLITKEDFFD